MNNTSYNTSQNEFGDGNESITIKEDFHPDETISDKNLESNL